MNLFNNKIEKNKDNLFDWVKNKNIAKNNQKKYDEMRNNFQELESNSLFVERKMF